MNGPNAKFSYFTPARVKKIIIFLLGALSSTIFVWSVYLTTLLILGEIDNPLIKIIGYFGVDLDLKLDESLALSNYYFIAITARFILAVLIFFLPTIIATTLSSHLIAIIKFGFSDYADDVKKAHKKEMSDAELSEFKQKRRTAKKTSASNSGVLAGLAIGAGLCWFFFRPKHIR